MENCEVKVIDYKVLDDGRHSVKLQLKLCNNNRVLRLAECIVPADDDTQESICMKALDKLKDRFQTFYDNNKDIENVVGTVLQLPEQDAILNQVITDLEN